LSARKIDALFSDLGGIPSRQDFEVAFKLAGFDRSNVLGLVHRLVEQDVFTNCLVLDPRVLLDERRRSSDENGLVLLLCQELRAKQCFLPFFKLRLIKHCR